MKVALFQPYVSDMNIIPSLGPLYLAAILEKQDYKVILFDEKINRNVFNEIISFKPDIFGVSTVTPAYIRGLKVSREIKKLFPSVRVVFGGPHPSALPLSVITEDVVDYVVMGEGEEAFPALCKRIKEGKDYYEYLKEIKGLAFKDKKGETYIIKKENYLSDDELDKIPFPAFHLMDLEGYFKSVQTHGLYQRGLRILPIITSRGCPYTCTFCCRVMGSTIRKRGIKNVVSEVDYLIRRYQIDELYIEDDNFTADKNRAIELLKLIRNSGIRYLKFANGLNINMVDEEILERMKEANVYSVSFGIESGCIKTLKRMRKNIDLERAKKVISYAKSLGLLVGANCIIGYPEETLTDIRGSLNYFFRLPLDSMAIVNLIPFPGTEVRKVCEEKGYLTEEARDWRNYYFSINNPIPLVETHVLNKKQLTRQIKRSYRKMYLNIFWLMKALKNISLKRIWLGAKIYFGFLSSKNI